MPFSCFSDSKDSLKSGRINKKAVKEILDSTDDFLCDIDGVLWDGAGVIPGSSDTISKLQDLGKRVFYVTNSTDRSRQTVTEKLNRYGFTCSKEQVICPAYAVAKYLKDLQFQDKVYLVGLADSIGHELTSIGIRHIGTGPDPHQGSLADWMAMEMDPEVKCVVVGFDPHISFMKMLKACTYLKNPDCMYLACHQDRILPVRGTEKCIPGAGCMVLPISHASGRTPVIIGKPQRTMFEVLNKEFLFHRERCLMIGDTLTADVAFAKNCGLKSLLVLSGVTSVRDLPLDRYRYAPRGDNEGQTSFNGDPLPDYCAHDLGEFGKNL